VSLFIQQAKQKRGRDLHIIAASSVEVVLAAACASKALFLKCTVFTTRDASQDAIEFLKREDAEVVVESDSYSEALEKAKAAVAANPKAYVP
jgi:L-serine/L-threonine ammonia-lyase